MEKKKGEFSILERNAVLPAQEKKRRSVTASPKGGKKELPSLRRESRCGEGKGGLGFKRKGARFTSAKTEKKARQQLYVRKGR